MKNAERNSFMVNLLKIICLILSTELNCIYMNRMHQSNSTSSNDKNIIKDKKARITLKDS